MAIRTDSDSVEAVLGDGYKAGVSLTPFITTANIMVDTTCLDSGYSTALLTQIETYLSAHYYHVSYRRPNIESTGAASDTYNAAETFLQMAKDLDHKGNIGLVEVGITWLGEVSDRET